MPRYLRISSIVAAAILALITAAVLAFNLHLQSPAIQTELREAAMRTIGLPLSVRSAVYTPWSGICLRGIVVPDMENQGVNFLEASEFRVMFRLIPLLRREFVVSRLSLREAVLTWRQAADGRWRVPRNPEQAVARAAGTPVTASPSASPAPAGTAGTPASATPGRTPFGVSVESVEVQRSRILFENRDRWPLLDADGITFEAELASRGGDARGNASVPEAVLAGLLVARNVGSDFTLENGLLTLPSIRGEVAAGVLSGSGSIATREEGSPYRWSLRLEGFKLQELRLSPKLGGTRIEGVLAASLDLDGRNAPNRRVRGNGHIEISGGRLVPSPYLQELGRVLDIRELRGMNLHEAKAELRVDDDLVHLEPLWLRADDIAVELRGSVTRSGKLDLKGSLLLSPGTAKSVAARTGRELPPSGNAVLPDYRVVSFKVGGSLEDPESDLASRLLGGGLGGQIGEFFLNFIGVP